MGELEADDAARLAGMTKASFLTRMSQLNGTPDELRLPKQPGRRARLYDEARLREWIASGRPTPDTRPSPIRDGAAPIPADASYDGLSWTLRTNDGTVTADTLTGAADQLRTMLARKHQAGPEDFDLKIHFSDGNESVRMWENSRQVREEATALRKKATHLAHEACITLSERGISQTDIALLFGVHRTNIQRALSES